MFPRKRIKFEEEPEWLPRRRIRYRLRGMPVITPSIDLTAVELPITEIFKITLTNGNRAFYTRHNENVEYRGNIYVSIPIKRGAINRGIDLKIEMVQITLGLVGITVGGSSIRDLIIGKYFDNAAVTLTQINYNDLRLTGREIFDGFISGGLSYDQGEMKFKVSSTLDILKKPFPKYMYKPTCNHKLYDTLCKLLEADFEETDTASASTARDRLQASIFNTTNHAPPYWGLGKIEFTSGANIGLIRTIKVHSSAAGVHQVTFYQPFDNLISSGDAFKAHPGCDKSGTTCDTKFANYDNFFGFEYMPKAEVMYT